MRRVVILRFLLLGAPFPVHLEPQPHPDEVQHAVDATLATMTPLVPSTVLHTFERHRMRDPLPRYFQRVQFDEIENMERWDVGVLLVQGACGSGHARS